MDFVDPDTGNPRPVTAVALEDPDTGISVRIKDVNGNYILPYWNGVQSFRGMVAEAGEQFYSLIAGSSASHGHKEGPISYAFLAEATTTTTTTTLTPAPGSSSANGPPVLIFGGRTFTGSPSDREDVVGRCTCPLGGGLSIVFTAKWESLGSSGGYTTIIDFGNGGSSNKIFIAGVGGSTSLLIALHYVGSWHNLTIPSVVGVGGYNRYLFTLGSSGYVEVYKNGGLIGSADFMDPLPYLSRSQLYVAPGFSGFVGGLIVWNRVVGWSECEVIPFTLVVVGSHHVGAGSSGAMVEYYLTGGSGGPGAVEWAYGVGSTVQLLYVSSCDGCRASQEVLLPGWPSNLTLTSLGGDSWGYKEITLTGGGWNPEVPGGGGSSFTNETRILLNSTYGELEGRNAFWLCQCECCHSSQVYHVPSTSNASRPALILAGREFSGGAGDSENMTAHVDGPLGGNFSMAFTARWDAPGTAIHFGGGGKHQLVVAGGGSSSTSLLLGHQFVNSAGELAWSNLTVANAITLGGGSARFLWTISAGGLSEVYKDGGLVGSLQAVAGPSTTVRSSLLVGQGGDQHFQGMVNGLMVWRKVVGWGDAGNVLPFGLSVTTSTRSGAGSTTGARVQYSAGGQWTVPQHYVGSVSEGEVVSSGFELTQWPGYVRLLAGGDDSWGYSQIALSQTGGQSKTVLTSTNGQVFHNNKFWVSTSTPPGSDVAPTSQTYCVPGVGGCSTSATGDPHITNILGQRFDLRRTGTHVMVQLPKGAAPNRTLLRVKASLFSEVPCGPTFIKSLMLTGRWAYQLQPGGIHFEARPGDVERHGWGSPARLNLGPVVVVVYLRHTGSGTPYLNLHVNLLKATDPVGGLFGEDDHRWATQPPECEHAHHARKGFLALSKSIQPDALAAKDGEGSVIRLAIKRHHHLELATNDAVAEDARDGLLDGWESPTS